MTKMVLSPALSTILAQAAAPAATPTAGPGMSTMIIFYALLMVGMYFLMIAPQRKKQKELERTIASLQSGDEVLTSSGIYGVITNVKEDRFVVRIAENTKVEVAKGSISTVVSKGESK